MQDKLQFPGEAQKADELIPITEYDGKTAVSLRDLHEFLEVSTKLKDWAPRMFDYGFVEGQDYVEVSLKNEQNPLGGRPARNWAITLDMAKELSMIQRTERGKQARQYFIAVEKRAVQAAPAKPSGAELLAMAVIEAQAMIAAKDQHIAALEPKADYADMVSESEGLRTLMDLANDLKVHAAANQPGVKVYRDDVFDLAGELGLIIRGNTVRNNQPTARGIEAGWVRPHEHTYEKSEGAFATKRYSRLTPRGYARVWEEAVRRLRAGQPLAKGKDAA
ncbi:antA/AntB antirepressor family protein [Glutamicibacter sp. FR1]|uniref:antA/AntB antirepressor family protein n=1 Tax=Glutamicibacter sp. FR1 TaxID=3393744 RepID=UPI0039AEB1D1